MKLYDVDGYDRPLLLSEDHAELLGATPHAVISETPARNGTVAEWRDFALSQGADPEAAQTMTRAQLIESYGG